MLRIFILKRGVEIKWQKTMSGFNIELDSRIRRKDMEFE